MIDQHLVDTLHDIFEEYYKQCEVGEEIAKALKLAGYKLSQEPQKVCPEWIETKDRLPGGHWNVNHPHLSEEVLIANSCSISIGFYNRFKGRWYVDAPAANNQIDKITHWMPLPANPHEHSISQVPSTPTEGMLPHIIHECQLMDNCDKCAPKQQAECVKSTTASGLLLTQTEMENLNDTFLISTSSDTHFPWAKTVAKAQLAKVLSNLPTEQEIRESERKEIGEWLEKVIAHAKDLNWADKADLNKGIDKLESGQSPKEV